MTPEVRLIQNMESAAAESPLKKTKTEPTYQSIAVRNLQEDHRLRVATYENMYPRTVCNEYVQNLEDDISAILYTICECEAFKLTLINEKTALMNSSNSQDLWRCNAHIQSVCEIDGEISKYESKVAGLTEELHNVYACLNKQTEAFKWCRHPPSHHDLLKRAKNKAQTEDLKMDL